MRFKRPESTELQEKARENAIANRLGPTMNSQPRLHGITSLDQWFGAGHDFHDAEILDVHLNRSATSLVRVHSWRMTKDVGPDGYFVHEQDAVVTIGFERITDLELVGFSNQNVIGELEILESDATCRVVFHPCYGLSGFIEAERVTFSLKPGSPPSS